MSNVSLSLVIPAYNRGSLIGATIDSALAQTVPFHDIVVVDDGSTDDTATVLARYAGRIRVIVVSNGGVQRARNIGVDAAGGAYVALCDSDDLLEPEFTTVVGGWLARHPDTDAMYCNFRTFSEAGIQDDKFAMAPPAFFAGARREDVFHADIPDLYARLLDYQPLFPTASVMRRDFYRRIGGYDVRFNRLGSEDLEFALRAVAHGSVVLCAQPLARVRKHDANDSTDTMRQVSGEVAILEFALAHHAVAGRYRDTILRSIEARRLDVFNAAFARGAFDVAHTALVQLRTPPRDGRFRLKALITRLPALVRGPLWRASQG